MNQYQPEHSFEELDEGPLFDLYVKTSTCRFARLAPTRRPFQSLSWPDWGNEVKQVCSDLGVVTERPLLDGLLEGDEVDVSTGSGVATLELEFRSFLPDQVGAWTVAISRPVEIVDDARPEQLWGDGAPATVGGFHSRTSAETNLRTVDSAVILDPLGVAVKSIEFEQGLIHYTDGKQAKVAPRRCFTSQHFRAAIEDARTAGFEVPLRQSHPLI